MALIDQLGAYKAAFYFVEREDVALMGTRELVATAARSLPPSDPLSTVPDLLPVWIGSYLPFQAARQRWAFSDVFVVLIGCTNAKRRRGLVAAVRKRPALGMFDLDADADALDLPLSFYGFVMPNAVIRQSASGRRIDRDTGLDVIGFDSDEEAEALNMAVAGFGSAWDPPEDLLGDVMLRLLTNGVGRRVPGVRAADGFEALVDQAFELFGIGAVGAAGSVAGVALEQLMRAALTGEDRVWLNTREREGHVKLNDVIGKVTKAGGWDDGRLRRYQHLRNDLAHRLGDKLDAPREEGELREAVEEMLGWLDRQELADDGTALLVDVAPEPDLTYAELLDAARGAGDAASKTARATPITVSGSSFEPIGFAWVTVRDPKKPFTRWLVESGNARSVSGGAEFFAPGRSLERNLAWAHACTMRIRQAGHAADYAGRPD